MIGSGIAHFAPDKRIGQPDQDRQVIRCAVNKGDVRDCEKPARVQRYQNEFDGRKQSESEGYAEAMLSLRNAQEARKQEKEENETALHHANRTLQGGDRLRQWITVPGV